MKLVRLENERFKILDGPVQIEGAYPQIRAQLLYEYEIAQAELERAEEAMRENAHDTAEFGINGFFTVSYSTFLERKVKSELRAIASVRKEFHALSQYQPGGPETKMVFDRLMHLYFSQDVDGALSLLGDTSSDGTAA
jgi:hypothetical protein